jgi:hypothetical protein
MINAYIKKIPVVLLSALALAGCTKQSKTSGPFPLSDVRPAVPVSVQNAMDYRPEPTVSTSISGGGAIQVILSIPSGSGRTIKEITKVAASISYVQIQSTGSTGFYTSAPIPGTGTTVTFSTSLTEYAAKAGGTAPAANTELAKKFYFLVTLDDNSVIVTDAVRVLVLS